MSALCETSIASVAQPPGVFICYARTDEPTVRNLVPSLEVMSNRGIIKKWLDTDIVPGEYWDDTIEQHLRESQIILFMVSRQFLASEYITQRERPLAMRLMREHKAVVIPVILSPCSWREEDFGQLQKLPVNAESVLSVTPREKFWAQLEQVMRKIAADMLSSPKS